MVAMTQQGPRRLAHPCPCKCRASREGINCFPGECVRDTVTSSGYEQQVPRNLFQGSPCPCTWSSSASLVFVMWRGMGVVPETLDLSVSDPWVPASTHLQVPDVEGLLEDYYRFTNLNPCSKKQRKAHVLNSAFTFAQASRYFKLPVNFR